MIKQTFNKGLFPVHVWTEDIESEAIDQLIKLSNMPFIHKHVAVMADCHAGKGSTVGTVIATVNAIIPAAVGVDIGCGMLGVPTNLTANDLPDSLLDIRLAIEDKIPVGFNAYNNIKHLTRNETDHLKSNVIENIFDEYKIKSGKQSPAEQMGSLGGGNHFIELCLDESDNVWVMLHSGSRGIGNKIGSVFIDLAKQDMEKAGISVPDKDLSYLTYGTQHFTDYVLAVEWAQVYAALNRKVMLRRVLEVLKSYFPHMVADLDKRMVNCHHNYISKEVHFEQECYVTRKGAVSARENEFGIIPGSMGTRSYIVQGLGNEESFHSCSHGAGRRMSRSKAKKVFTQADHEKATAGVECRKDVGVLDETPGAYKDIDKVMENQTDLVKPVHTLKQILCVKG